MIVVFSGYNQRAVVAFLRTLERDELDYQIIASSSDDQIFLTSYKDKVVYTRKDKNLDLDDIVCGLQKVRKEKINLIAPSTEALNRFLLKNRIHFEKLGFTIPLVDEELYASISDKSKFVEICKENGILTPKEYDLTEKFERPLVAKPKTYIGSDGISYPPIFILDHDMQTAFIKEHAVEEFDYQEYLDGGRSIYLLFYFDKNGNFWVLSQENYIQQPDGKSMQCAKVTDHYKDPVITQPYVKLFEKLGFRGLVMVELRQVGEEYYMIEANPRFWGPSQLFCDANYNLFERLLIDYGLLEDMPISDPEETYYFWSNGMSAQDIEGGRLVFHGDGEEIFKQNYGAIEKMDIYNRNDTNKIYDVEKLKQLYSKTSKHSNYQILPDALARIVGEGLPVRSRYEKERLAYIEKNIELGNKHFLDIGGNTGFFTIQSILDGAEHFDYYEGNVTHADFVKTACEVLDIKQKVDIFPEYYNFEQSFEHKKYDVIYNLNVLHHMGDDFDSGKTKELAKKDIIDCINRMASTTDVMVFQLGFNWKGNPNECLFADGTKAELIDYIKTGTKDFWNIKNIGIAVKNAAGQIVYEDLNDINIERQDLLGEFLNRPLFIMEAIK